MKSNLCDFVLKDGSRCKKIGWKDFQGVIRCGDHRVKRRIIGHPKRFASMLRKKINSAILVSRIYGIYSEEIVKAATIFLELARRIETGILI